jgi:hypothetical protein
MSVSSNLSNGHKKRDLFIICLLIGSIAFASYLKYDYDNFTSKQLEKQTQNQKVIVANQKALAKGINTIGNIIINDVATELPDIKDKTDLIDNIQLDVSKILNQTILYNGSLVTTPLNETDINFTQ